VRFADGSVLTAISNGEALPAYTQVKLSLSHRFDHLATGPDAVQLDGVICSSGPITIRNGAGVGVFAPQFGPRRGVFVGLTRQLG
jgi:outer membrane receptor for ferrienterochelin and colicins